MGIWGSVRRLLCAPRLSLDGNSVQLPVARARHDDTSVVRARRCLTVAPRTRTARNAVVDPRGKEQNSAGAEASSQTASSFRGHPIGPPFDIDKPGAADRGVRVHPHPRESGQAGRPAREVFVALAAVSEHAFQPLGSAPRALGETLLGLPPARAAPTRPWGAPCAPR